MGTCVEALMRVWLICPPRQAFHCAEPTSRQVACVPLFATLLAYEVYYGLTEEEGAEPTEHQVRPGGSQVSGGGSLHPSRVRVASTRAHPDGGDGLAAAS